MALLLEQPFVQPAAEIRTRVTGAPLVLDAAGYVGIGTTIGTAGQIRGGSYLAATYNPGGGGNEYVLRGDVAGSIIFGDATKAPSIYYDAVTVQYFRIGGLVRMELANTIAEFALPTIRYKSTVVAPELIQETDSTAGVTGDTLTIHAQDCDGGGASVGGKLAFRGGHGVTHGDVRVLDADGVTIRAIFGGYEAGVLGGATTDVCLNAGGYIYFYVNGAIVAYAISTGLNYNAPIMQFEPAVASPSIFHATDTTADVVADDFTIYAQGVSAAGGTHAHAGSLGLRGGIATGNAANTDGNIWCHVAPASWNAMEKGVFVADAVTAPTGNPASGGYLFSLAGALYWHAPSGAVTMIAPA